MFSISPYHNRGSHIDTVPEKSGRKILTSIVDTADEYSKTYFALRAEVGIVNEIVPHGELMAAAQRRANIPVGALMAVQALTLTPE